MSLCFHPQLLSRNAVCANLQQLFNPGTQESHQVPAIDRIACNSGTPGLYWSSARWGVKEKVEWSFTCLQLITESSATIFNDMAAWLPPTYSIIITIINVQFLSRFFSLYLSFFVCSECEALLISVKEKGYKKLTNLLVLRLFQEPIYFCWYIFLLYVIQGVKIPT